MNYIAEINAFDELNTREPSNGVMLNAADTLDDMQDQRLLVQSLLLFPPETLEDTRLQQLHTIQNAYWLTKITSCTQKQLCVRLPDGPMEAFLPSLPAEFEMLADYMHCSNEALHERVQAVWNSHPDLSYYMIISNDILFEAMLRGLFSAAQECGIEKMSILLPLVSRCREVQQQHMFVTNCAVDYDVSCDVGIEIATPRAICFASALASYADVIVFNVDELCWLLYGGKTQRTDRHTYGFHEIPFNEFDDIGIGTLIGVAMQEIRESNPDVRLCASGKYVLTEKGRKFCRELGIHSLIAANNLFPSEKD